MLAPEMKIPTKGGLDRVMVYLFTCGSVCGTLEFSTVGVTVSVGADPTAGSPSLNRWVDLNHRHAYAASSRIHSVSTVH